MRDAAKIARHQCNIGCPNRYVAPKRTHCDTDPPYRKARRPVAQRNGRVSRQSGRAQRGAKKYDCCDRSDEEDRPLPGASEAYESLIGSNRRNIATGAIGPVMPRGDSPMMFAID